MILDRIPHVPLVAPIVAVAIQAVPVFDSVLVARLKDIGLIGWLILCGIVLYRKLESQEQLMWRKLEEKDKLITAMQLATTTSLTANNVIIEGMKDSMNDLRTTIDHLVTVRETLHDVGTTKRR